MTSPSVAARLAPLGAAVAAALAGALAGVGITVAAPVAGIADPGTGVLVGLPLVRAMLAVTAAATIGLCLLPLLLGTPSPSSNTGDTGPTEGTGHTESTGDVDRAAAVLHRARWWAVVTSMAWAATAVAALFLHTAELTANGTGITLADVGGYVGSVATGKALLSVIALVLLLCGLNVLAVRHRERVPAEIRTGLGVFALLPLPATGHAAGWMGHGYAVVALELHVISAVVWLGGLAALAVLLARDTTLLAWALPRFSVVATCCIAATAVTGTIIGLTHLGTHGSISVGLISTPYGALLLAKLACFGVIALAGAKMRWRILPAVVARHGQSRHAFAAWASIELLLLGLAIGIASVLARAGFG